MEKFSADKNIYFLGKGLYVFLNILKYFYTKYKYLYLY